MSDTSVTKSEQKPKRKRTLLQRVVNVFLYIGLVLLSCLIIFFAVSQTRMFKNWLRDIVVELANDNLNGKISIESIEGTLFTSLILKNTIVTMENDTLLNAGMIEVRTSPLKIFLKTIYIRKIEIKDTQIALLEDSSGNLNISKLFPPSEEADTSESHFPFRIQVADFKLTNVSFTLQNYSKFKSSEVYSSLNMDDFRLKDIFLSLKAFADIKNNTYEAKIEHLSFKPNISEFNLNSFSGEFAINPKEIIANNLAFNTTHSEILLNVKVDDFNIFDSMMTDHLRYALMNVSLSSNKFDFNDLSAFVPAVDMFKGVVGIQLQASGNLIQLDVDKIKLDYEKTHLETKAVVRNIDNVDEMTISTEFKNSFITQTDINKLLPEYGIPVFENLGLVKIDSLMFDGKPGNFESKIILSTQGGQFTSIMKMNFEKPITEYDINFSSKNFNLMPVANISSSLNLNGQFIGRGFSPEQMDAKILLVGDGLTVEGIALDALSLNAKAKEGIIDYTLFSAAGSAKAEIDGSLDLLQANMGYKANGKVSNLDISQLMKDSTTVTDLNFNFKTEGENFDIDKMNMFLTFNLSPSVINGIKIDSIRTITDIFTDNNDNRVINFISDIADVTVKGQFSLVNIISVLSEESSLLTNAFINKIDELLQPNNFDDSLTETKTFENTKLNTNLKRGESVSFLFLADLKDFGIISPFLQNKRFEIDGNLSGKIQYDADSINLTLVSDMNYVKYWGKTDIYFLSKMNLDLNLSNGINVRSTDDIDLKLIANTSRVFAGSDLNNIYLNLDFKKNIANINLEAAYEKSASGKFSCLADLRSSTINLDIDTLDFVYNGFDVRNWEKINVSVSPERIDFNNFKLYHSNSEISAIGFLAADEEQNLNLSIKNLQGKDLIKSISNGNGYNFLDINLNLNGTVNGRYSNPVMHFELSGKNLTYKDQNFGDLISVFQYAGETFTSDIKFFDAYSGSAVPALKLIGNIPINLSFTDTGKRLIDNEEIEINLIANHLDLTPFGELIPGVRRFKGKLNSNLNVSGTIRELNPDGFLKLDNSSFHLNYNNLEYQAGLKVSVTRDKLYLDSLLLANSKETKFGGKIVGGGTAELENLNMTSSQFAFNGSLKVLSEESRYVSPNLYGDLVISTNGNFDLKFDKNGANLKAPINIDVAKLTYSQVQGSYTSTSENYIYKFIEDTVTKDSKEMDFAALINLSKANESEKIQKANKPGKLDYNIDVRVEDEAVLTYVLSREFNQNLVAVLRGNFQYESVGGKPISQGELELLEGSTLEFVKTFNAEGKIRFESELSNPYLDITAIYKNYYYKGENSSGTEGDQSTGDEVEVAVKMNIKGALQELDKNLSQQSEKLAVYVDNELDQTKDASDAVMFMLLGKFIDDGVSQQEKSIVSTYATSFAGSIVGGFLNRQLGDYVKSLEIRQSGTDTKFILAGRAGKFRYSVGGSTSVFQDLGLANVKIEYPIARNFFMRLERKEALSDTQYLNEMINELGLKYRFEF